MHSLEFPEYEVVKELLSELLDEYPEVFFEALHGGVLLDAHTKYHPESVPNKPLYIMGEYIRSPLGSQIKIYYGSYKCVYPMITLAKLRETLKKTLSHEFTHHLEYKAGLKDLEIKDHRNLESYRSQQSSSEKK